MANQGCVNEGTDTRPLGWLVCPLQRLLSFKGQPPNIHAHDNWGYSLKWPYVVVNKRRSDGRWRMFRFGWRYDRNWQGYIFPTAAFKVIDQPLRYY